MVHSHCVPAQPQQSRDCFTQECRCMQRQSRFGYISPGTQSKILVVNLKLSKLKSKNEVKVKSASPSPAVQKPIAVELSRTIGQYDHIMICIVHYRSSMLLGTQLSSSGISTLANQSTQHHWTNTTDTTQTEAETSSLLSSMSKSTLLLFSSYKTYHYITMTTVPSARVSECPNIYTVYSLYNSPQQMLLFFGAFVGRVALSSTVWEITDLYPNCRTTSRSTLGQTGRVNSSPST